MKGRGRDRFLARRRQRTNDHALLVEYVEVLPLHWFDVNVGGGKVSARAHSADQNEAVSSKFYTSLEESV